MTPRDWNASSYHRLSTPHQSWGRQVLDRLDLRGDETVLDAGCGTGRITQQLHDRGPGIRAIAVDGSPAMVEQARETLDPERVTVLCQDLVELSLDEPAGAAISTATFHWIADHDTLFARMHDALVPGAPFVAQCGGAGNVARLEAILAEVGAREPFAPALGGWPGPWNYQTPEATAERLDRAGFDVADCWLNPDPVVPEDPRGFLDSVVLGAHLDRLDPELRPGFVDAVLAELGEPPELDYVRLNWIARRR
jgi:trans-aconitate 2-methyltransferase